MLKRSLVLLVAGLLFLVCAAPSDARGVNVKHANADYGSWKTWAFLDNPEKLAAVKAAGNLEVFEIIRAAIVERLEKQGFSQAAEGQAPDFWVDVEGTMREVMNVQNIHRQVSDHVAFVMDGGISSYREGTLLVRMLEGGSENVVWTGWVVDEVKDPDKPARQIQRAVKRILKQFPPKG